VITFTDDKRFALSVVGQRRLEGNTSVGRLGGGVGGLLQPSAPQSMRLLSGRQ
jgi:hypothetical protein